MTKDDPVDSWKAHEAIEAARGYWSPLTLDESADNPWLKVFVDAYVMGLQRGLDINY